jgi:hypothetical protein
MGVRFFYLPKHRKFNYIPRVYDPDKERRERYKEKDEGAQNENTEYTGYSERMRGAIKQHSIKIEKVPVYSQLTRLVIILILMTTLLAAVYLIFKYLMLI